MITAGENPNLLWQYLVNQAVFLVDAPRPTPSQLVFEGFGFTDAGKRIALCICHQPNDADRLASIMLSPPGNVFECGRVELDASHKRSFATASSSGTPVRRSSAARRRCRIVSDFKR